MTLIEKLKLQLLGGEVVNKFTFLGATNSLSLTQRIHDLGLEGWVISRGTVKGKGNLVEYWLEEEEITRQKELIRKEEERLERLRLNG